MKHTVDIDDLKQRYRLSDVVTMASVKLTRSRHELVGLCPFHNEKTPSFYVYDAEGVFNCFGCGASGNIIKFVRDTQGVDFLQAVAMITGGDIRAVTPAERAVSDAKEKADYTAAALAIWNRAVNYRGTVAEAYAKARGIEAPLPGSIRFAPCRYPSEVQPRPAMICAAQAVDRSITGIQRIYLKPDGSDRARDVPSGRGKLSLGNVRGSALRLGPVADEVTIVEGPEDGLTLMQQHPEKSVWVSLGTSNMHNIELPEQVRRVVLAGDNNDAGRIAVDRAGEAFIGQGREVSAIYPDAAFVDWNAQLMGAR